MLNNVTNSDQVVNNQNINFTLELPIIKYLQIIQYCCVYNLDFYFQVRKETLQ